MALIPNGSHDVWSGPTIQPRAAMREAAARWGTPLYLTDATAIAAAASSIQAAFPDPWLRHYSVKANDVPAVIRLVAAAGFGANVVSRGEWSAARQAGVPNERITLEGIGKTDADLRSALGAAEGGHPLRWLAIESADEAEALVRLSTRKQVRQSAGRELPPVDVLFRLNPNVEPETSADFAVGAGHSKFGMTASEISRAVAIVAQARDRLRPAGIHLHVGSQLRAVESWRTAVRAALDLGTRIRESVPDFDTVDVGGGFPVGSITEQLPTPERFATELRKSIDELTPEQRPARIAIEPGRSLVARAGWLVARVLHVRDRFGRQVVLDTGMTELIRPALYGVMHPIFGLTSLAEPFDSDQPNRLSPVRVEGPICESTDSLGEHALPPLRRGDLVAIRDAGAYAVSLSSTYNGRARPAQIVLNSGGELELARRRGASRNITA